MLFFDEGIEEIEVKLEMTDKQLKLLKRMHPNAKIICYVDDIGDIIGETSEDGRYLAHVCMDLIISDLQTRGKKGFGLTILYDSNFNEAMEKYGFIYRLKNS